MRVSDPVVVGTAVWDGSEIVAVSVRENGEDGVVDSVPTEAVSAAENVEDFDEGCVTVLGGVRYCVEDLVRVGITLRECVLVRSMRLWL